MTGHLEWPMYLNTESIHFLHWLQIAKPGMFIARG